MTINYGWHKAQHTHNLNFVFNTKQPTYSSKCNRSMPSSFNSEICWQIQAVIFRHSYDAFHVKNTKLLLYIQQEQHHSTTSAPMCNCVMIFRLWHIFAEARTPGFIIPQIWSSGERFWAQFNTLRTGLLNCLNARSRGLTFRHRASCI